MDELSEVRPFIRPLFGCIAVYVGNKIVLVLREKEAVPHDNGVWLASSEDRHEALRSEFQFMRSVSVLGAGVTAWQNLPVDAPDFGRSVTRACELIRQSSPLTGNVPRARRRRTAEP